MAAIGIGIYVGGVVIRREDYHEDATAYGPVLTMNSEIVGARDGLRQLASLFDGRVFLVSKCGPLTENRLNEWLDEFGLLEAAGVSSMNVRFCRRRVDKAGICADLALTHMVDDRLEIINLLTGIVQHRFLFSPDPGEIDRFGPTPRGVSSSVSWDELVADISQSVDRADEAR